MADKQRRYTAEEIADLWKDGTPTQSNLNDFQNQLYDYYRDQLKNDSAYQDAYWKNYFTLPNQYDEYAYNWKKEHGGQFTPIEYSGGKTKDQWMNEKTDEFFKNWVNSNYLTAQDYYDEWQKNRETENALPQDETAYAEGSKEWQQKMQELYGGADWGDDAHTPLAELAQRYGIDWDPDNMMTAYYKLMKVYSDKAKQKMSDQAQNTNNAVDDDASVHQKEAEGNTQAAITAGVSAGNAGLLGNSNAVNNTGSVTSSVANNRAALGSSTQADYTRKMSDVANMQQTADNLKKGATLNTAGAVLQGMGTGASLGAGVSDENMKENPNRSEPTDEELIDSIKKFMNLAKRLEGLKKCGM